MEIVIRPSGVLVGIYSDSFDYGTFGKPTIRRASHVEPDESGRWTADLSPVGGPKLGPFDKRNKAIDAEFEYLYTIISSSTNDK